MQYVCEVVQRGSSADCERAIFCSHRAEPTARLQGDYPNAVCDGRKQRPCTRQTALETALTGKELGTLMKGFSIVPAELCAEGKERTTISGIGRGMGCNAKGDIKGN